MFPFAWSFALSFFHCMTSIALFLLYSTFLSYLVFHQLLVALLPPSSEPWISSPRHYFSSWRLSVPSFLSFFHFIFTVPCKEPCSDLNQIMSALLETLQWFLPLRVKWKFSVITLNFCMSFYHFLTFQLLWLSLRSPYIRHSALLAVPPACETHTRLQGICPWSSLL